MSALLTVEIHDVTPAAGEEVAEIHAALRAIGVEHPVLLVVPAFEDGEGRSWDLREHPAMARWLREEQARGAELVLHGLTHRAPGPPPPGVRPWVMHHWFSRGCAELAHLSRAEAAWRLAAGREVLEHCGLRSEGFIAPAWQQSEGAQAAVAEAGFRFTAFFQHVEVLAPERRRVESPVLTFAAPDPLTDHGKRLFMRAVEAAGRHRALLRVALHPEDVHGARPLAHALERIRVLLGRRRLVRYGDWLDTLGVAA